MLNASSLADSIRSGMGFPTPVSSQLNGMATSIVNEIKSNSVVAFASGGVTGTAPPSGGPLTGGAASGGTITGLSGSRMATAMASAMGFSSVSSQLSGMCNAIANHIMTGVAAFASGNITGTCTNTAVSPGTFSGTGANGTINGLNATTLATAIHSNCGFPGSPSSQVQALASAIVTHIQSNGVVALASATGTCTPGGGPITAGAGSGGTIS